MEQGKNKTGRIFTTALKHDKENKNWCDKERIMELLKEYRGTYEIYAIVHNKDVFEETGELKEEHTHFLIMTNTPRKIKTIANLLNVEENMINFAKSKKASMRYLLHLDNPEKYQYNELEIMTNSKTTYREQVEKGETTDKEIFETIMYNGVKYTIMVYLNKVEMTKILTAIKLYKEMQLDEIGKIAKSTPSIPKIEELKIKS